MHESAAPHPGMGLVERRETGAISRVPWNGPRLHLRQRSSRLPTTSPVVLQQETRHPHHHRGRLLQRPRLRDQIRGQDQEILLPSQGPRETLGSGGICRPIHRTLRHHSHDDSHPPHRRLLHRSIANGAHKSKQGEAHPRHGPHRQGPRLHPIQVIAGLHNGFSSVPPFSHYRR